MRRIRSFSAAAALVVAVTFGAGAARQNPPQAAQSAPRDAALQEQLNGAATLLASIDARAVSGDTGRTLQTLRQDFTALQTAFNEQLLSGPVGNAPAGAAAKPETDWRIRYASVESDLADLIGQPSVADPSNILSTGAADLDPRVREQLQQLRTRLEKFFAAALGANEPQPAGPVTQPTAPTIAPPQTAGQPPAPPTPAPASIPPPASLTSLAAPSAPTSDVLPLLDRIETIVAEALSQTSAAASASKPQSTATTGTTGAAAGRPTGAAGQTTAGITVKGASSNKVTIERDKLNEIQVEIEQLKALLKK